MNARATEYEDLMKQGRIEAAHEALDRHDEALLTTAREEVKRIRRDVRAVLREWESYPASYPRTAFIEDVLSALNP